MLKCTSPRLEVIVKPAFNPAAVTSPCPELIVTFADFDIVRILTAGGPQDMTHIIATYAFAVGLQSGDIPLGASVSLFMLPILAICAYFVLRGVTRRAKEIAA